MLFERIEKPVYAIMFGAIAPVALFLTGWWGMVPFTKNGNIFLLTSLSGLAAGLLISWRYAPAFVRKAYDVPPYCLIAVYGFYSVCLLGFFMGVPVFNITLGLPAGFYAAMKCAKGGKDRSYITRTAVLTTVFMLFVCAVSAVIALRDPYTARNLQGMLRPGFEITNSMVLALIVIGGMFLVAAQYWLTALTGKYVLGKMGGGHLSCAKIFADGDRNLYNF